MYDEHPQCSSALQFHLHLTRDGRRGYPQLNSGTHKNWVQLDARSFLHIIVLHRHPPKRKRHNSLQAINNSLQQHALFARISRPLSFLLAVLCPKEDARERPAAARHQQEDSNGGGGGEAGRPNPCPLEAMFLALEQVLPLFRRRRQASLLKQIRPAVEGMCGRSFTRQHLARIVYVQPGEQMCTSSPPLPSCMSSCILRPAPSSGRGTSNERTISEKPRIRCPGFDVHACVHAVDARRSRMSSVLLCKRESADRVVPK